MKISLGYLCLSILLFPSFSQAHQPSKLSDAALQQVGVTLTYDSRYVSLKYPNGDVPEYTGVCTDVLIRAARKAYGLDLQQSLHEDMTAHFNLYPKLWRLTAPDKNIDHRRVQNLQTYFSRFHSVLPISTNPNDYLPGDIVTSLVDNRLPHIMIISHHLSNDGTPLVIHNIGRGTKEENELFTYPLTGHYRLKLPTISHP